MQRAWGGVALVVTFALVWSSRAVAAEPWIDVKQASGLSVIAVESDGIDGGGERQIVRATAAGAPITLVVDRPVDSSYLPLYDPTVISNPTRSAKHMTRALKLEGSGSNFQRIRGRDSAGATIDYDDGLCRAAVVGVGKSEGGWRYLVVGFTCGAANDVMTTYLTNARPAPRR